jgi:hypothetical protein
MRREDIAEGVTLYLGDNYKILGLIYLTPSHDLARLSR